MATQKKSTKKTNSAKTNTKGKNQKTTSVADSSRKQGIVLGTFIFSIFMAAVVFIDAEGGWGYGNAPEALEEFYERYKGLTDALLDSKHIFGFCYTQLYDVEQEQNGLLTYQRVHKFDTEKIKAINTRKAVIED